MPLDPDLLAESQKSAREGIKGFIGGHLDRMHLLFLNNNRVSTLGGTIMDTIHRLLIRRGTSEGMS